MNNENIDVIIERLDNLKETLNKFQEENKEQHSKMQRQQEYTNGKVRALQIWKGTLAGVISVVMFIIGYIITDYIKMSGDVTEQKVMYGKLTEKVDNIYSTICKDKTN